MRKDHRVLHILMNGITVGRLVKIPSGILSFEYDTEWLSQNSSRPISLSLPLMGKNFTGDVVYNFFDNLLPDNSLIRSRIQTRFKIPTDQPFDLLASIGKDCIGAIQIVESEVSSSVKEIEYEILTEHEIATTLRGYRNSPLGMVENAKEFRISIAGAQEKSAFLYYKDEWCRPIGQTPTSHIFKLPIGVITHQQIDLSESCEIEWLCLQIAHAYGLPVPAAEVLHFEDVKVLAVERFDRRLSNDKKWIMRLPQEDMCQALNVSSNLKYQSDGGPGINDIMRLLMNSSHPLQDREMFFRAQVLFWILAAIDGHAKNFSIFIEPEGAYRLTPLYDIISAYPLIAKKQLQQQKIKVAMALKGASNHYLWHNIQPRHFLSTAKAVGFSPELAMQIVDEMLSNVEKVIDTVRADLPSDFPKHISDPIFDGMLAMLQHRQRG